MAPRQRGCFPSAEYTSVEFNGKGREVRLIPHFRPLFRCLQFIFVRSPEAVLHQLEWEAASRQQLLLWDPTSQPTPLLLESPSYLLIISTHQCSDFINSHRIQGLLLNIFVVVAVVDCICWLTPFISIVCSAPKRVALKTTVTLLSRWVKDRRWGLFSILLGLYSHFKTLLIFHHVLQDLVICVIIFYYIKQ